MSTIPTIGRRVYYYPAVNELNGLANAKYRGQENPHWEAGIVWVEPQMPDGRWTINAIVTAPNGGLWFRENVILADSRETAYPGDCYWMPYQVNQQKTA